MCAIYQIYQHMQIYICAYTNVSGYTAHLSMWHKTFMWHEKIIGVTWRTHSYVWRDSSLDIHEALHSGGSAYTCVTWLTHMWTWLFQTCETTDPCAWHHYINMCDVTHSHVWHDSFTCVTRPIHMCDVTHLKTSTRPSTVVAVAVESTRFCAFR